MSRAVFISFLSKNSRKITQNVEVVEGECTNITVDASVAVKSIIGTRS